MKMKAPQGKLQNLYDKQLEIEMEIKAIEDEIDRPKPISNPNFDPVVDLCEVNMIHLIEHGFWGKDFEHYVFETVIQAIYGMDVFEWINWKLG